MTPRQRLIYREYLKRQKEKQAFRNLFPTDEILFGRQRTLFNDLSMFVSACCSRRGGKSYAAAAKMIAVGHTFANATIPYIALTRPSAKNIMWRILTGILERFKIAHNAKESDLEIVFPNKTNLLLLGADQKNFMARIKGGKYPLSVVDESQAFRDHIGELIADVLTPAAFDYPGQIWSLGTPGKIPQGFFFDATKHNTTWSTHHWTMFDNPHLPHAAKLLEMYLREHKLDIDSPTIQREFFGRWVEDIESLVYKYKPSINSYSDDSDIPDRHRNVMGIDLGFNDQNAISIITYNLDDNRKWIRETYGKEGMTLSAFAEVLEKYIKLYLPIKIVGDAGGLGKSIIEEFNYRFKNTATIEVAQKVDKEGSIELVNNDLRRGLLKVHETLAVDLVSEYAHLEIVNGHEDPNGINHHSDATLYAYRECPTITKQQTTTKTLEDKMLDLELDEFEKQQARYRRYGG